VQWLKPIVKVTWEVEIGGIVVQSQPGQKVCESPTSTNGWVVVATACQHPAKLGSTNRRMVVQGGLQNKARPSLIVHKHKRPGRMAQLVAYLVPTQDAQVPEFNP
jgi:hypothetical protein